MKFSAAVLLTHFSIQLLKVNNSVSESSAAASVGISLCGVCLWAAHTGGLPRGSSGDKRASGFLLPCEVFQVSPTEGDGVLEEESVFPSGG